MRIFLDSSALAKRYVAEAGTEQVLERCGEADEIVLSVIVLPELLSAFNRLRREGHLDLNGYTRLKDELTGDLAEATLVDLTPDVIATSIDCLERFTLRSLDALHLAAAVCSRVDLFVSSDRRQCQAARGSGLRVDEVAS